MPQTIHDVTNPVAKRLMRGVVRRFGEGATRHDVQSSVTALINCMLLAIRNGRPRGVTAWATRAAQDFGAAQAINLGMCVADALGEEATRDAHNFGKDHDGVDLVLQASVVRIWEAAATFESGMFPGGFADSGAGYALLAAARKRDPSCRLHLVAVGLWVRRLCARMRLNPEVAPIAEACAGLRAIRQAGVPETAVYANPKLTRYAAAVRAQHERWDGTGHPDRLMGHEIPLEARIAAVAEGISEMMRRTPDPGEADAARDIIEGLKQGAGTEWDPEIVRSLLEILGVPADDEARNAL
ncbi:MAG TPA: HD domain-containing phosphohydrolase [Candidatus Baltobacteraceae bacterium]|nr:HD domain-containing phosphohydrolase [Candidatus Baltobacteraceae bacterium]